VLEVRHGILLEDLRRILAAPRGVELAANVSPTKFADIIAARETTGGVLYEDGVPVVAAGVSRLAPPYAFVWLVAGRELQLSYLRVILPPMRAAIAAAAAQGLVICAATTPGQEAAERFIKRLGFERQANGHWELKKHEY
jgi:hypothetical protein